VQNLDKFFLTVAESLCVALCN